MKIDDLLILKELAKLFPDGEEFRQLQIYPSDQWRSYTNDSPVRELIKYFPSWGQSEFILIGGTDFGDAIIVTNSDPISESGAIYILGEGFGVNGSNDWPEGLLCLGHSATQWNERIQSFGDEPAIAPGSIDEELGERAENYNHQMRAMNPGLTW